MALTQVDGGLLSPTNAQYTGFKNRIINGAMQIDQRNAGASVSSNSATNPYTLDRWRSVASTGSGQFTTQQSSTSTNGFVNSLLVTSSASTVVGSSDYYCIRQPIEGFNTADLMWGTVNAQTITLSFWVRSSLTGTFGGSIGNQNADRSYPFSYTISSANTFEYKTITISGDTTGTWYTDNRGSINLWFGLGVGSTKSGTAGSWAGADYRSATGATSVVGTNGATFYITGVQLEKGSTATSFDYRPYGTELSLCQRYAYFIRGSTTKNPLIGTGWWDAGTANRTVTSFPVTMRAVPSIVFSAYSDFGALQVNVSWNSVSNISLPSEVSEYSGALSVTSSGGTTGQISALRIMTNNSSAYFGYTAEL